MNLNADTVRELKKAMNTANFMRFGYSYKSAEAYAERIFKEASK